MSAGRRNSLFRFRRIIPIFAILIAALLASGLFGLLNSNNYSQISWETESQGNNISILADDAAFLSDVKVTSTKIDDKDILNLAKRTAGQNSDNVLAFDITFTDKDGNEKQPNSYVKVTINPKDYNLDAERYALVHIDDEKNAKYIGNIAASNGLLTFYANSFSIYAIIPTTQTDQQRYARYTYEFYVNDELAASQIVRNGDILNAPAAPSLERLIFMGWYTENDRVFNGLNLAVNIPDDTTADKTIKLHARFADKIYSVLFFNPQGNVLATKTGTNGDSINTDDIRHEVSAGHFVDAWTTDASILDRYVGCGNDCEIPDDEVIPNQITGDITINNENIRLYPIIRSVKWIHYHQNDDDNDSHTEASYTASDYAFYGHTVSAPNNPTRNGYDFVGWARDEQGTNMYDFNTPLTSDIDLYAIWRPRTNTQYRIIFWKESLDNGHYVPGNYDYASYIDTTGTSGSMTTATQAQINSVLSQSNMTYYELDHIGDSEAIHGDGSTILDVYLKLKVYTVNFTVETRSGNRYCFNYYNANNTATTTCQSTSHATNGNMTAVYTDTNGNTHDLTQGYSFQARMGEIISDRYPSAGEIELTYTGNAMRNIKAYAWRAVDNNPSNTIRVSKPITMTEDLLLSNKTGGTTLYIFGALSTTPVDVNYWFQKPDGSGYERSEEYSFTANTPGSPENFNGRVVTGYTLLTNTPSGYEGSSGNTRNFYYNRNTYSLYFYNYNAAGNTYNNIRHGANLTLYDYIPARPSGLSNAFTFQGWYTTPEYIDGTEFDLTSDVMPMSDLMLYAKWENTNYVTVSFNPNGGQPIPSQRVLYGNTASVVDDPVRVGYSFVGWRKTDGAFFSFDNIILEDTELVASWVPYDTIYVHYNPNGGTIYNQDDLSYVDTSTTAILPMPDVVPEGKYFVGWNVNGRIYYPGNVVMILLSDIPDGGDTLTIVAEWGKEVDKTSYTYNPNTATTGDETTFEQEQNEAFIVKSAEELGYSKTGYTFKGWNSEPDGSGVSYAVGTQWAADNRATLPNVLYAQWEINCYTVTVYHQYENGTEYDATQSFEKCFNETYETSPSTKDSTYYGAVTSGEPSGTITDSDVSVTYTYRKRDALITVYHLDENGNTLAPKEEIPVSFDDAYNILPNSELIQFYNYTADVPTTGTVSGDVVITFTYTKKEFTLTVNHQYEDGTKYDESTTDTYLYLDQYTATPSTKDNNYEVVNTIGSATGVINGDTTVTFVYAKKQATITVYHRDAQGNNLINPVTSTAEWGDPYHVYPDADLLVSYDYSVEGTESGTVGGDVVVVYTYTKKTFQLTINHITNTGATLESSTDSYEYGYQYTTSPITRPDYELVSVDGDESGTLTSNVTVTYTYKKKTFTVTVNHIIEDADNITETITIEYGNPCPAQPKSNLLAEYNYTVSGDPCGNSVTSNITVNYNYTRKHFTLTIRHIDETGSTIIADKTEDKKYGDAYNVAADASLSNAYVCTTSDNTTGTITGDTTITFVCAKRHYTVTTHHIYADGSEYAEDVTDDYEYGATYTTRPLTNDEDYESTLADGSVASGEVTGNIEVTYIYAKKKYTLIVKHVDANGAELADTTTTTFESGSTYETHPDADLTATYNYTVDGAESGTIRSNLTITYIYTKKQYTLTVKHVDADGNNLVTPQISQVEHGSTYTTSPVAELLVNYNYTVDKDETGTISGNLTVTYTYTKKIATVIVHHVNTEGETIAGDVTFTVEYGETYTTTVADNIPANYEFLSRTDNYTDTASQARIEVTYTYQKKDPSLNSTISIIDGDDTITNDSKKSDYKVNYTANVDDFIGDAQIVIVNQLPYPIDPDQSNLDGGVYDPATNTIKWIVDTEVTEAPKAIAIEKNVSVVFTGVVSTDRVATNTVEGTITLDTNKTRTTSGSATLAVKIMGYATVHYYIEGTTNSVKNDDHLSGLVGDTFSVEIPEIDGYEIVKVEVRVAAVNTYTFKDQAQEIVISYRALPEPEPEPEPEEPVNPSTTSDINLVPVFGVFAGVAIGLFTILRRRRI